jgi:hypothetical protein
MKINIKNINFKIEYKISPVSDKKKPDLRANVSIIFRDKERQDNWMIFTGFSLRESKFEAGTLYLAYPARFNFRFFLIEQSFKKLLEKEVIEQYNDISIPVID